jgi:uncharacterized SAM-binding protein YcdF (DUF218 family)
MAASIALTEPPPRQAKCRYLIRLSVVVAVSAAAAWIAGFGWFLYLASRTVPPISHADAIVVLTGGPDRIEVALGLLSGGAADQLLVSGAGERTDLAALAHVAGIDPAPLERRISLGHAARSTRGNALETASWAREHGIHTILVVTTWFHMPRAVVELNRTMPLIKARPYPVGHLEPSSLVCGAEARRIVVEYNKYLVALTGMTTSRFMLDAWGLVLAK